MRPTRLLPAALIALVALAGGALALGITMNATHANAIADQSVAGEHTLAADDHGATATGGVVSNLGSALGRADVALPTVPPVPAMPALTTMDLPVDAPALPETPAPAAR